MAKPTDFSDANFTWLAPPILNQYVNAQSLRTCEFKDFDGVQHNFSCWELTEQEINIIKETGKIYVDLMSPQHPAISVTPHEPMMHYPKQVMELREKNKDTGTRPFYPHEDKSND